ncbi:MAG: NADH-quinone oxidoreductase subunit H [Gemmatimonadaceae bacterium]
MISYGRLLGELATIAVVLLAGVYATVVIDLWAGRMVARAPVRAFRVLTFPIRQTALFLLQQPATTERPDAPLWALAPALLAAIAAASLLVIPFSPQTSAAGIESGIVYFGALMALVMIAVYLNGWSANSVFPMIGGYRFIAEALSYEMPLALVLIGAALPAQSLSVSAIVISQDSLWNVIRQPLGLPIYLAAGLGVAFWGPLALPDAADLAGGTESELSGVQLLLWRTTRIAVLVAVAAMGAAVFLGGWTGPWLPGAVWMTVKTISLIFIMVVSRHLVARVRLERFVVVAWTVLIPLALLDVFAAGAVVLAGSPR